MHCYSVPNTLKIQSRARSTLLQRQHFKRLLNFITHKHSVKCNPFVYLSLYQKLTPAPTIHNNLLDLCSGCSKLVPTLSLPEDCILTKLLLQ